MKPIDEFINKVIHGDSQEVLKTFPDDCIDLVVTSCPYDMMRVYGGIEWNLSVSTNMIRELARILKVGGVIVWVVNDEYKNKSMTGTSFRQCLCFQEMGLNIHDVMIYEKTGWSFPATNRYNQMFEFMFVISKGPPKTFNPIKDRPNKWKSSWGKNTKRNPKTGELEERKQYKYNEFGMRGNIWRYATGKGFSVRDDNDIAYGHPAIMPTQLAKDHILSWSNKDDIVLDCFCGSATTLYEAKMLGRKYIGIEIHKEYVDICNERLSGYLF
tara:strand:+ start:677 stop:1486 length:810 start_codon:yes stop_codon:yes gene_type:complete